MKHGSKFKWFLFAVAIVAFMILASTYVSDKNAQNTAQKKVENLMSPDLGMTFEEFKTAYETKVPDVNEIFSLADANIENKSDVRFCRFNFADVVMKVYGKNDTGNITMIAVLARPFKNTTKAEKTTILLSQSTIFTLATMPFCPDMAQQEYRESMIKRMYSNYDTNFLMGENLRCKATKKGDVIALIARHKDFNEDEILENYLNFDR